MKLHNKIFSYLRNLFALGKQIYQTDLIKILENTRLSLEFSVSKK